MISELLAKLIHRAPPPILTCRIHRASDGTPEFQVNGKRVTEEEYWNRLRQFVTQDDSGDSG